MPYKGLRRAERAEARMAPTEACAAAHTDMRRAGRRKQQHWGSLLQAGAVLSSRTEPALIFCSSPPGLRLFMTRVPSAHSPTRITAGFGALELKIPPLPPTHKEKPFLYPRA